MFIWISYGVKVEISRTTPKLHAEALLSAEVPEIKDGSVIIQASSNSRRES